MQRPQAPGGNYRYIPLLVPVTDAKEMLGIESTTVHDPFLYRLAGNALLRMNSLKTMGVKNTVLDIVEGETELPNNMIRFIAIRYCDEKGISYGPYLADFSFMEECRCRCEDGSECGDWGSLMMIQDNKLIFQYPEYAPKKINMAYVGRNADSHGAAMIYDYMSEAVKYFIMYNFVERYPNQYTPTQHASWQQQWKSQHDRVISYDAMQSFQNNFERMVSLSHPVIIRL